MAEHSNINREREAALVTMLSQARHDPGVAAVVEYAQLLQARSERMLRSCAIDELQKIQGEVAAYQRIIDAVLTTA